MGRTEEKGTKISFPLASVPNLRVEAWVMDPK
jgi:hypothetical protein